MTRTAVVDNGSWATAVAAVPDGPTPAVVDPIEAHRHDSDGLAEELNRGKASAGAGGDRGGSEGGQNIGRPLSFCYFLEASMISPKFTQRSPSNFASCSCSIG